MNNQIKIEIEDSQVKIDITNPIDFPTLIQVFATATLSAMNTLLNNAPSEHQETIKADIYDIYNQAASRTLELFAPEFELRPDLTADAIRQIENQLLDENWNSLSLEEKARLKTAKSKLRPIPIRPNTK